MKNIIDYSKTNLYTFSEKRFNNVDSLILSQLSYINFDNLVGSITTNKSPITFKDLLNPKYFNKMFNTIPYSKETKELLFYISSNPRFRNIKINYYISKSDVAFEKQRSLFYEMIGNCKFKYIHCCNSAAMTYHHDEKSNMGRLGITMYGCSPNGEKETKFKQVMSLYTKVAMIKKIPAGDQVGYGLTYTAKEDEYIATLPIGYADGFIRKNQGRKVYINGKYYEIVGRVCMDQMMVRVDENVKIGDQVEIFGEHISLESMAKDLDTISYEVLCLISKRVPRVYVQDGQVKELL